MVSKKTKKNGGMCKCDCHVHKKVFLGIWLLVLGVVFLLNNLGKVSDSFTGAAWPILVLILGAMFVMKGFHKCGCCTQSH